MRKIQKFQISLLTVMIISLIYPLCGMSQESTNPSTIGKIEILDDGMNELISPDAEIELLATGFEWSEGPLWVHDEKDGYLIFSDIPKNSIIASSSANTVTAEFQDWKKPAVKRPLPTATTASVSTARTMLLLSQMATFISLTPHMVYQKVSKIQGASLTIAAFTASQQLVR
jgi:hypothetical protein